MAPPDELSTATGKTVPAMPGGTTRPDVATVETAARFDPLVGSTLADRYRIIRKIGEGGMGAVYEAEHAVIGKRVAVKVLLEKFLEKTDLVARLLQEARLASSIGHENIVDVTDFGTTSDGRSFVVMEFLEGESLAALVIRDSPLPVERCLRIARQVASALGAAHAKGIVHRDVKPENVYLVRRGELDFVKVVDFGVSKAVRTREDSIESQRLTHTGMVLGTPVYMSPEQARGGDDIDSRADIWALGVMLYECLTGEVPFRANNYLGVISQVLTQDVQPPSRVRPELGIPVAVEAVVMRAMQKDREKRYRVMSDLERDIDRLLAGDQNLGSPMPLPSPANSVTLVGPRWHLGVAAVLVISIGLVVALVTVDGKPPETPKAVVETLVKPAPVAPAPPAPAAPVASQPPAESVSGSQVPRTRKAGPPPAASSQKRLMQVGGDLVPVRSEGNDRKR